MKSSLEGRNNATAAGSVWSSAQGVSMKSGLEGRNNTGTPSWTGASGGGLNEVRPRRPEQFNGGAIEAYQTAIVSMKSGLEGRNNPPSACWKRTGRASRLNEVGPRRPEQYPDTPRVVFTMCLNEVRPRRPEQFICRYCARLWPCEVSMKSGLEGRNNPLPRRG